MPIFLEETLDRVLQHTLYLHRVEALKAAELEIQRNATNMFRQQAWATLMVFYEADLSEARKEDDEDRRVGILLVLIAAMLANRAGRDVKILEPGIKRALQTAIEQSAFSKYGVTAALDDIDAGEYLRVHGAELVTGINSYTRERMRAMLVDAFKRGESLEDTALKLMLSFDEMTYARAMKIARTEASKAWSYAEMMSAERMEAAGYRMVKEWLLGPMHPRYDICDHNHEEGAIPLKQLFSSGDMAPPQHPNCGCSLITYPSDGDQPWGSQIFGQTPLMPFGSDSGDRNA